MSWGVYDSLTPLMNELDSIASLKSPPIMVASMGNEGISVDNNVHYPSDHEDVLAVTGLAIGLHPSDVNPYVNNYPDEVHWACSNYSFQTNRRYIAAPCALTLRDDPVAAQGTSHTLLRWLPEGLRISIGDASKHYAKEAVRSCKIHAKTYYILFAIKKDKAPHSVFTQLDDENWTCSIIYLNTEFWRMGPVHRHRRSCLCNKRSALRTFTG